MVKIALKKKNIDLNQGFIKAMKASGGPNIAYRGKNKAFIKMHETKDTFFITSEKNDIQFVLNINGMAKCSIKVTNGYIRTNAVASEESKNFTKVGAIELKIKKEEVGSVYMKVGSGIILADGNLVKLNRLQPSGFEGFFQGDLPEQKTQLIVESGAIVCTIE